MTNEEIVTTLNSLLPLEKAQRSELLKSRDGKQIFKDIQDSEIYKSWSASQNREHRAYRKLVDRLAE